MIRNRAIGRRIGDAPLYVPGEPLYSFSQDPRVANNPNPIYAPGSPQYMAAVAAGAVDPNTGQSYSLPVGTPAASLAPGTWNGNCNNPVVADSAGNLAYIAQCYPNTPLGVSLISQQAGGGPLALNPGTTAAVPAPAAAAAPAALPATLSSLSTIPWYYWAGGAAALFLLFKK